MDYPSFDKLKLNRPANIRIQKIFEQIRSGSYPSCPFLARELEVAEKTIRRDIDMMRDQMNLPIAYDASRRGFYFTERVDHFPNAFVSEAELFALMVAQKSLEAYHGTPYELPLAQAFTKIVSGLDHKISFNISNLGQVISFKPLGYANLDMDIMRVVTRAVQSNRELTFRYKGYNDAMAKKRHVQPWHLSCVDNQWYLIGYDLDRKARRNFLLVRMSRLDILEKRFTPPSGFKPEEAFQGAFGVFGGSDQIKVMLTFTGAAARLIKEKTWHSSQTIEDQPDGSVLLSLEVANFHEIERWILSWGEDVKVESPPELREQLRSHIQRMAAAYP
jgi:predicted DNA-binding transcriptional regulator YafY